MKMADRITHPSSLRRIGFATTVLGACFAFKVPAASYAQSIIAESTAEANSRFDESVTAAGFAPSSPASGGYSPFNLRQMTVRPHFSYRYLYGDGIRSGPSRQENTSVHTVSPGVLFELGPRWQIDYTATQTYYSSDAFRDRLSHTARATGGAGYGNLALTFNYRFSDTSAPLAETAEQTRQQTHNASLSAGYSLGSRTGLTSSVSYSTRSSATTLGYREWSFVEGIRYHVSPKVNAGLNLGFGFVDVDEGSDMSYFRPSVQVGWQPVAKISLGAQTGWEERKFKDTDLATRGRPTYSGSIAYRPLETTTIALSASRGTSVSYFRNFATENRSWSLSVRQRLLERFTLSAAYSERKSDYIATLAGLVASRSDDSSTFNLRLGTQVFERGSFGLTYQTTDYKSNVSDFAYDSEQYGAEFSYRF